MASENEAIAENVVVLWNTNTIQYNTIRYIKYNTNASYLSKVVVSSVPHCVAICEHGQAQFVGVSYGI